MSELTAITHRTLDPIALIQCSDRAESTKDKYTRALRPYLDDGGNLANEADVDYPLDRLVGDAVLLDFSHKKAGEEITRQEVIDLGIEVRPGDIVFVRTDMHKLWKTPRAHDRPVLSIEATRYLVEEIGIHCIGTDATGLEVRGRDDQPVHAILFTHDVAMVESLTNLDQLRSTRFQVIMLPLMVEGLDACPVRAVALEEEEAA